MGLWGQHSLMPSGESFQKKHVELGFVIIPISFCYVDLEKKCRCTEKQIKSLPHQVSGLGHSLAEL